MNKEENSFDKTVEIFKEEGADSILLENFKDGMITGVPYNSKTGQIWWGLSMISDFEEVKNCKYNKVCSTDDKELVEKLDLLFKK